MSRHDSAATDQVAAGPARPDLHRTRRITAVAALALLSTVAACGGDDDDAASSTDAPGTSADVATTPPAEITTPESTEVLEIEATPEGTTDDSVLNDSEPETARDATSGSDTTIADDSPDAAAAASATETSAADVGPTTTGPECEFTENSSLPLERCDMGPPVAVVQSILQANGYDIGIDGKFGDQTLYALRAFQEEEGLTVDGIVGLESWTELDVPDAYGADANGNGIIDPNEIDLTE